MTFQARIVTSRAVGALACGALAALGACHRASGPASGPASGTAGSAAAPVAVVNGTALSRNLFDLYLRTVSQGRVHGASELSGEQQAQALDNLVRAELVAQQATREGLPVQSDVADTLELSRLNVLEQVDSDRYLRDRPPTEAELRAEYQSQLAQLPPLEYHARHILVATEPFARRLIAQLDGGASFTDLARRESMDGSKDNGGDLGWFTPNNMAKSFADAVVALKPGQYTHEPVQTAYGWHIIELEATRPLTPPSFDQARPRLQQIVQARKFRAYTDQLLKGAKVERHL